MPQGQNRRVGIAHHPHDQQSPWWSVALLTILPAVIFWPQIATGQPMGNAAALSPVGVGEETSPLRVGPSTQSLEPEDPPNLEWGEPLPTKPESPTPETPTLADPNSELDPTSPSVDEAGDPVYLRPSEACPAEYENLVTTLLRDLPQYANLVAARSFRLPMNRPAPDTSGATTPPTPSPVGTMLIASQPDFEPIDLTDRAFGAGLDPASDLRQVFFTTLERQYLSHQVVSLQQFHWLFLVQTEDGWRSVLIYSSLGGDPARPLADQRLTPPQESSQGIVGQAVRLWLRDCRAGAVFPPASSHR